MEYALIHLANGIRIVLHHNLSPVSHVSLIINAGSRDEESGKFGLAHLIEHLLFKQTEKRNTNQILNRLESVGGDLNAYTTKEYTCLHASFLSPYLGRALDLFEDLLFHSVFPEREMEKEKGVILDEMASYLDNPEESVVDDFEDLLFHGHSLGHNILGTANELRRLSKIDIINFVRQYYNTHELAVGISGNYTVQDVERIATRVFGDIPSREVGNTRRPPGEFRTQHVSLAKPINQVHYVLGSPAYHIHDDRKTGLLLLNNVLGGMGMSSRLNLVVREKHGIAYTIESNYTPYSDTGLFYIYFGTDEEKSARAQILVQKELRRLRDNKLGTLQLHQAKQKFKGQIALGEENRLNLIISLTKGVLDYGRVQLLDEVFARIDATTADQLLEIANDTFDEQRLSSLSFVPE